MSVPSCIVATSVATMALMASATCLAQEPPAAGAPTEAEARQAQEARRARDPAWQALNRAMAELRSAYQARGGESFETASRRVSQARAGELDALIREWGQGAVSTSSMQGVIGGAQVQASMQSNPNLTLSGLDRTQREAMVGGLLGGMGLTVRADAAADRAVVVWSARLIDTLAREPGLDPARALRVRELADTAAELADYGHDTVEQDIGRIERRIADTGAVSDLTDVFEQGGAFRDDRSRDPFRIRLGELILEIGADGSVRYTGPDPDVDGALASGHFEPGRNGLPSAGAVEQVEAYLRRVPGGAAALAQFRRELERMQRRTNGGAGSAGGGGASQVVEGDLPDDVLDLRHDELQVIADRLRARGIDLGLSNGGPPFVIRQFMAGGRVLEVIELADIYAGYHLQSAPFIVRSGPSSVGSGPSTVGVTPSSAGTSLSTVGTSLSSVGTSLSAAGTSLSSAGTSLSAAGTSPSAVWTSMSAAGTPTGSAVWMSPDFWRPTGVSSASDWTDPYRRSGSWIRPNPLELPSELCGR